jgi:GNAT superfamily N-acetyltransferase
MFLADGDTAPADVGLDDSNALPFKLTISCVNFEQRAEFQRTLFNIDQPSPCNTFEWAATGSNGIDHSSRPLPDRPRLSGAVVEGQIQGLLEFCRTGMPGHSEVALVVAPHWRRKGLGWALLRGAMRLGLQTRAPSIRMIFPRTNWPMRKIARKANAQLDLIFDQIHAVVGLTNAISGASETTGSRS